MGHSNLQRKEKKRKKRKKEERDWLVDFPNSVITCTTKMFAPQKDVENEKTSKRGLVRWSERGLNFPEVGKRSGSDVVGWWEKTMTFRGLWFVISLRFVPSVLGHISDPVIGMRSARPDVSLIMASGPSSDLGSPPSSARHGRSTRKDFPSFLFFFLLQSYFCSSSLFFSSSSSFLFLSFFLLFFSFLLPQMMAVESVCPPTIRAPYTSFEALGSPLRRC